MSMDQHPGPSPGTSGPAYQGAKPGAMTADMVSVFEGLGGPSARDLMNARLAQNWWAIALRGVFALVFGILALALPGITLAALVLVFAAYMLVDGVLDIIAAVRAARRGERWGWLIFEGIVDLAAGAVAFLWPGITLLVFVLLLGAWAIVSGVSLFAAALSLHATHGRGLMIFGAVVSVIWGILLVLWPLIGAVVLALWIGAYALLFGGSLLVVAFRLRRRHQAPSLTLAQSA